jgi:hypothetical protein
LKKHREKIIKSSNLLRNRDKEIQTQRDILYTKVKELDQENRISSLKLREVGRQLKHNQLNPLGPIRGSHDITSKISETGSKKLYTKRGSTSNLLGSSKSKKRLTRTDRKSLGKGANTKSTQLLNKKHYSKPTDGSDDELEKNQIINYDNNKEQRESKETKGK